MKRIQRQPRRIMALSLALASLCYLANAWTAGSDLHSSTSVYAAETVEAEADQATDSYQRYLSAHGYDGTLASDSIALDLSTYEVEDNLLVEDQPEGLVTGDRGRITWTFEAPQSGFYQMKVHYFTVPSTHSNISRRVWLDGEVPYDEWHHILFRRLWEDQPILLAEDGENEIRPTTSECPEDQAVYMYDQDTLYDTPLMLYLEKGEHKLSFESIKEPLGLRAITLEAAPVVPNYEAYLNAHSDVADYTGETLLGQAERIDGITTRILKNSPSIIVNLNYSDPAIEPSHSYLMLYNTIGAESWQQPGDLVSWEVDVPEEGFYELSFKARQHLNRGVTAYRRLRVNGEIPFDYATGIPFDYSGDMVWHTIKAGEEPAKIYLQAGKNTISLETVQGAMGDMIKESRLSLQALNQMYLRTIQLTGQAPDRYIDYEVAKKIPDFASVMQQESDRLFGIVDKIVEATGEKGERTAILEKMAVQAAALAKDPEDVTEQVLQLQNNISGVATWLVQTSQMPLEVDQLALKASEAQLPRAKAGFFQRMGFGIQRFISTFTVDRTALETSQVEEKPLKVWMVTGSSNIPGSITSGLEQAQVLRGMINDTYTPTYGRGVNLELIPTDVVLRSALAGNGPDVIVGLGQGVLGDFAMRDALLDLNRFEDYASVAETYMPSSLVNSSYQLKNYGLPEQMTFMMLFYRQDILKDLDLEVPETWDDVKQMIPHLQMNHYEFFMPGSAFYDSLVYQYGADLYLGEGSDYGIQSGLRSEAALKAFSDYTEFFTTYKLPVQVDFANRFRTGEVPIGLAEYSLYNQLEVFAPEIRGKWSFAPIPGIENEDGNVNRSYIPNTVQSAILSGTEQEEASWEFLKWWTSPESQVRYGNTLESILGSAARYFPASMEALEQLPWSTAELDVLADQIDETLGVPAIPGYYMHGREVGYAYNDVVVQSQNPREALYLNIRTIDEELSKKRQEFDLNFIDWNEENR